jgi:hypothetical protein
MRHIYLAIGEHLIQVVSGSLQLMDRFQRNYHVMMTPPDRQPDLLIQIEDGYGVPFKNYEVAISKQSNKLSFSRADYLIEADSTYHSVRISVYDDLALKHALIHVYSSYIVYKHWGVLLHSSCVINEGKAHVFAGRSGAGKSTAAQLSHPRMLLSDEATLIKITPEQITVFNSPFRSELEVTGSEKSCPLASIQILHQAHQNKRVYMNKSSGLLQLMDKVFYWSHNPQETAAILKSMHILVNTVPIYELYFQKNNTFWELIS